MRGQQFIHRVQNGLSPWSHLALRVGRTGDRPKFAGVRLSAPDHVAAWGIVQQVVDGEYAYPGLEPGPGDRVIDIGANIGIFSLWAERRGADVVAAYEPGPAAFAALQQNVAGRRVVPVHAAVVGTAQGETVDLFLHDERSTRNTLVGHEIGSGAALTNRVSVPAVSVHEVLGEGCDLLKVDCEGGEFDILNAASEDELRRAARLVIEFHRSVGEPQSLIDRVDAAGFDARILAGEADDEAFGIIGAIRQD